MTGLPQMDVVRVQRWCRARVPEHVRDQVPVEADVAQRHLRIVECRPPWRPELGPKWTRFPIARLRYTRVTKQWSLYWRDRNLLLHEYDLVSPTEGVEDLWAEVDRDPTAIFWWMPPASLAPLTPERPAPGVSPTVSPGASPTVSPGAMAPSPPGR